MQTHPAHLYRKLPQLDELLHCPDFLCLEQTYSRELIAEALRSTLQDLRAEIRAGRHTDDSLDLQLNGLSVKVAHRLRDATRPSLRRVLNATGVILQTNLGRAPLSEAAIQRIAEVARGYSNLEFDLETGERNSRDLHVERLILDVVALKSGQDPPGFPHKSAAVVNNCAAANFLALNTLAEGGEVLVSRGELVEIGGGFRVPDILRKSGAILREVGTTNRTRISDYATAITPQTRLILRVHRSNFRMEGFTGRPALEELLELGNHASLPVFEDQGTGCIVDLAEAGIRDESSWIQSASSDLALVACSGDKLLGGPQCGIVVGARSYLDRIRANPLFRALRVDKLTYAALEATLLAYLTTTEETLPAIAMLRMDAETTRARCLAIAARLGSANAAVEVIETRSLVGGGTTPGASLASFALALRPAHVSEEVFARNMRHLDPPVVVRIHAGRVLLDLRTIPAAEDALLTELLRQALELEQP
jgi:L-seryl-tRNA(Ser) seleniumtransferase